MAKSQFDAVLRQIRQLAGPNEAAAEEDAAVLERFVVQKDEAAFDVLMQRHGAMVLGLCRRILQDQHLADDVFQATFLLLVRKAGSIAKRGSVGSWLYGVAYRIASRTRNGVKRRQNREQEVTDMPATKTDTDASREIRPIVDEEVHRLPEKYREAIVSCYLEGKTYDEAALALGCPKGTVSIRLTRARDMLHKRLTRRGITLSAATITTILSESSLSAAVPAALANTTMKAALSVAAGSSLAAIGVSTPVAAALEGVTREMFIARIMRSAAFVLVLGLVGGVGMAAHLTLADKPKTASTEKNSLADTRAKKKAPEKNPIRLVLHVGPSSMEFSPNGAYLATSDLNTVLWSVATGKEIRQFEGANGVFSPNGEILATFEARDRTGPNNYSFRLWNVATGEEISKFDKVGPAGDFPFAFSANGKHLAFTYFDPKRGYVTKLWDLEQRKVLWTWESQQRPISSLSFSPDGKTLAVYSSHDLKPNADNVPHLLDVASGKETRKLDGPGSRVDEESGYDSKLIFTADGKHLIVSHDLGRPMTQDKPRFLDPQFLIWDLASGKTVLNDEVSGSPVALSSTGKRLASVTHPIQSGMKNRLVEELSIRLWDIGEKKNPRRIPIAKDVMFLALAFSPDEKSLLGVTQEGSVKIWETATLTVRKKFDAGLKSPVVKAAYSHESTTLAVAGKDGSVIIRKNVFGK